MDRIGMHSLKESCITGFGSYHFTLGGLSGGKAVVEGQAQ